MIFTSMRLPEFAQSVCVPVTVRLKVSHETPSTQVLSPLAAPVPGAVPSHASAAPAGPIEPEGGFAENNWAPEIASRITTTALMKKRAAALTRAVREKAAFFMGRDGVSG